MKILRNTAQGFGMPEKQKPTGRQAGRDARNDGLRNLRREIHDDVAAKYDVERLRLPEGGVGSGKVSLLERHHAADLGIENKVTSLGANVPRMERGFRL